MNPVVEHKLIPLRDLCEIYHVKDLFLFGSAVKDTFREDSDLDFLVNFSSNLDIQHYADNYFDFLDELQQLFGRDVDLVSEKSLKNPVFIQEINKTKVPVYEP